MKSQLSERDICTKYITSTISKSVWNNPSELEAQLEQSQKGSEMLMQAVLQEAVGK